MFKQQNNSTRKVIKIDRTFVKNSSSDWILLDIDTTDRKKKKTIW